MFREMSIEDLCPFYNHFVVVVELWGLLVLAPVLRAGEAGVGLGPSLLLGEPLAELSLLVHNGHPQGWGPFCASAHQSQCGFLKISLAIKLAFSPTSSGSAGWWLCDCGVILMGFRNRAGPLFICSAILDLPILSKRHFLSYFQ